MVEDARIIDLGPREVHPIVNALVDNQQAVMEAIGLKTLDVATFAGEKPLIIYDGVHLERVGGEWHAWDIEFRESADEDE